jgi:hypothetical protein
MLERNGKVREFKPSAIRIADEGFLDYLNACARLRTQKTK